MVLARTGSHTLLDALLSLLCSILKLLFLDTQGLADDAAHLVELGALELLHDNLQLRRLDESSQLLEAVSTVANIVLSVDVRHTEFGQQMLRRRVLVEVCLRHVSVDAAVVEAKELASHIDSRDGLQLLKEIVKGEVFCCEIDWFIARKPYHSSNDILRDVQISI